jgi:glycosyltransferase involved in cell wall biosynthesis
MTPHLIVHVYLLCYNEEKIIKNIIDYYAKFCTKIFVMDNMSTDKTLEIANSYDSVAVIPWESDHIDEAQYVHMKSQTYKDYSREGGKFTDETADWVISCDMDEVLYHPNILEVLAKYDLLNISVPQITGINIVGNNEINPQKCLIEQYKYGLRAEGFDKRIIFKPDFNMTFHQGCHPRGDGFECMKNTYGYTTSNKFPLALLHYKHIGKRLYEAALRNYNRLSESDEKLIGRGKNSAVGKYYKNIIDNSVFSSPLIKFALELFDLHGEINFINFSSTTGEIGLIDSRKVFNDHDINFLRDFAMSLEPVNIHFAYKLMNFVSEFRPSGKGILEKLEQYKKKIGDNKS